MNTSQIEAVEVAAARGRMNSKEKMEYERLQRAWATGKATKKQIMRCMELDRQVASELSKQ